MFDEQNVLFKENIDEDELFVDFIIWCFGVEVMNFIVLLVVGIYVVNFFEFSMKVVFLQFFVLEQKYGSVIKGSCVMFCVQGLIFGLFKDGMFILVNVVVVKLIGDVWLNMFVLVVYLDGVILIGGEKIVVSGVVLMVFVWVVVLMLGQSFFVVFVLVGELQMNGLVVVIFVYCEGQFFCDMYLYGF